MRIAVVNTKGGVGKTTTSILLACAAVRVGRTVEVWDADPQGSATTWALTAADADDPLPFNVVAVNATHLKRLRQHTPTVDLLIVDTPPGGADAVQLAIDAADLVVIPTLASGMDMQRVWPTLDAASHRNRAVLITSAEPRTNAHSAAVDVLTDQHEPLFSTVIPKRQGVRAMFGTNPHGLYRYDELLTEIQEAMT
ncbi:ParA family protein [Actinomyces sp. 594]|uniref:ParA family protein n=1 Tax=Actinomyces sp. 594 TaxID=2057793 RepID=UPI001C5993AE|nr:ParA family protein [Actinomyces sp. 594]MBW3069613.1 ParA family protein [Actinomyces sp. 594]